MPDQITTSARHGLYTLMDILGIPFPLEFVNEGQLNDVPPNSIVLVYGLNGIVGELAASAHKLLFIPKATSAGGISDTLSFVKNSKDPLIPIPYSATSGIAVPENCKSINFDIFEATYLLISSAYESVPDNAGNFYFPTSSNIQSPFSDIPLVDEYAKLFENSVRELFDNAGLPFIKKLAQPPGRTMTFVLTMDFDTYYKNNLERLKQIWGAACILNKKFKNKKAQFLPVFKKGHQYFRYIVKKDVYDRLPSILNWLNERNLFATFNIYCRYSSDAQLNGLSKFTQYIYDPNYNISDLKDYIKLMRRMHEDGHDIGLQYGAFSCSRNLSEIVVQKRQFVNHFGFAPVSGRNHFLSQRLPVFHELMERASIEIDTSAGFLDKSGFRNYTVSPYLGYNFMRNRASNVLHLSTPLWDGVLSDGHNESWGKIVDEIHKYIDKTAEYSGTIASGIHLRAFESDDYYCNHWATFEEAYKRVISLGGKTDTCANFLAWWLMRKEIKASIKKKKAQIELLIKRNKADAIIFELSFKDQTIRIESYQDKNNLKCENDKSPNFIKQIQKRNENIYIAIDNSIK